jgi:hypothetical protein
MGKMKALKEEMKADEEKRPRTYRRELKIQNPGSSPVRIVVTEDGATIDAKGLVPEKLAKLLEQNLADLVS